MQLSIIAHLPDDLGKRVYISKVAYILVTETGCCNCNMPAVGIIKEKYTSGEYDFKYLCSECLKKVGIYN